MAYIGSSPAEKGIGLFSQDTFTGDGSTTTFDLSNVMPDGGSNDIQVFVDNVRQQSGSSKAFTIGNDGSGDLKRITFTTAPAASAAIYVLNPGTKNVQQISTVSDNTVTTAKVQDLAVSTAKIAADAITEAKIADDAISEEHLDNTAITGNAELSATAADDDVLLIFDTSSSTIKKIQSSNVGITPPTFSSVSPTSLTTGDGTGNHTIVVTGTKFDSSATFKLRTDGGSDIAMDTVTRNSATQLTGVVAKNTANLTNANEPFDIVINNGSGLQVVATNQLNVDASPVYVTSAGTLGTLTGGVAMTAVNIVATDPESAGNVTFEFQSGALPAGLSSATINENGVSKFRISGTPTNPGANTTSNFVLRAVDAASNTTSRAFSITVNRVPTRQSFTSSGTFAVPSGMSSLSAVLVVAGGGQAARAHGSTGVGGGGAGGLVYMPAVPVTPGGTIAVTVGDGGAGPAGSGSGTEQGTKGQNSVFGASPSPGISAALTAVGGGAGTTGTCQPIPSNQQGGSGGGGGYGTGGGTALQPTQSGNSGAYGFGSAGGSASQTGPGEGGAGGGGAGGAGAAGGVPAATTGGAGGVGKAYTIGDGTTSVYYAGGGGGSAGGTGTSGVGGQGGGSDAAISSSTNPGAANKGGGSGGARGGYNAGTGGKGIVIVEY